MLSSTKLGMCQGHPLLATKGLVSSLLPASETILQRNFGVLRIQMTPCRLRNSPQRQRHQANTIVLLSSRILILVVMPCVGIETRTPLKVWA